MTDDSAGGAPSDYVGLNFPEDLMTCVLPLFAVTERQAIFVGSSFMYRDELVTARHVAVELDEWVNRSYGIWAAAYALAMTPDGRTWECHVPSIRAASDEFANSDLAVCTVDLPDGLVNGYDLVSLDVSSDWVDEGTETVAVGHTTAERMINLNSVGKLEEVIAFTSVEARVRASYPSYMHLKAPCFEMDGPIPGGASGGPIFDAASGRVIGVCSYAPTRASQSVVRSFGTMTRNLFQDPEPLPETGWLPR